MNVGPRQLDFVGLGFLCMPVIAGARVMQGPEEERVIALTRFDRVNGGQGRIPNHARDIRSPAGLDIQGLVQIAG
jgi:hypothetical protein